MRGLTEAELSSYYRTLEVLRGGFGVVVVVRRPPSIYLGIQRSLTCYNACKSFQGIGNMVVLDRYALSRSFLSQQILEDRRHQITGRESERGIDTGIFAEGVLATYLPPEPLCARTI